MIHSPNSHEIQFPILKTLHAVKERLCITTSQGHEIIIKQEVLFLKAESNYCTIQLANRKMLCCQTLSDVSSRFRLGNFLRIHHSYFVNIEKVLRFSSSYDSLTMEDGSVLPISRRNKKITKSTINMMFD